jgi:RNA-binding protein YhbY
MNTEEILKKAKAYRDATAQNLSKIIKVPGLSGKGKDRIALLKKLCEEAGFDEVRIDGLGSVLGRVGKGSKKFVFDATSTPSIPAIARSGNSIPSPASSRTA